MKTPKTKPKKKVSKVKEEKVWAVCLKNKLFPTKLLTDHAGRYMIYETRALARDVAKDYSIVPFVDVISFSLPVTKKR